MRLLAILISLEHCVEIVRGPGFAHRLGMEGPAMLGGWLGSLSPVKSLILGTGGRRKECQSACMHECMRYPTKFHQRNILARYSSVV